MGITALNLSSARKASIRASWSNALIVKVTGKTVGINSSHRGSCPVGNLVAN